MSRRRLSVGIGAFAADKVVVALVQLVMVPVLANVWGLTLYGIWAMVLTVPTFLVLGDFGIVSTAAGRMIGFVSREEWDEARATLHTACVVTFSIITLLAIGIGLVLWLLPLGVVPVTQGFGDAQSRLTLMLLLVYGLCTIVFRLITSAYRASMRYTLAVMCGTTTYTLENGAVVVAALMGFGPVQAAAAMLALRLLAILAAVVASFSIVPKLRPGFHAASRKEWGHMWKPALAASAFGFGLMGYLQGSVVMLGAICGAAAVPAFIAVRTLSRQGVQLATLVSVPVSQEFANAMAKGEVYRAGRYFGLVFVVAVVLASTAGVGLVALGEPFIRIWTHGAIRADHALLLFMAISSFASMFWNPLSNLILVLNQHQSYSYANLIASGLGLALIWAVAGRYGAPVAGLSFALVDLVTLGAVALFIWRHWLGVPEFRAGISRSLAEMRQPLAMLRSIRRTA